MSEQNPHNPFTPVPIHASGVRPLTFMGGERTPVLAGLFFCFYCAFFISLRYRVWIGVPVGVVLWMGWLAMTRAMTKADPQMWQILRRHRSYRAFYPARGRLNAPGPGYGDFKLKCRASGSRWCWGSAARLDMRLRRAVLACARNIAMKRKAWLTCCAMQDQSIRAFCLAKVAS